VQPHGNNHGSILSTSIFLSCKIYFLKTLSQNKKTHSLRVGRIFFLLNPLTETPLAT